MKRLCVYAFSFALGCLTLIPVAPASPHGGLTTTIEGPTGHVGPSSPKDTPAKKRRARKSSAGSLSPVLKKFKLSPKNVFIQGRDAVIRFLILDRDKKVRVRLTIQRGKGRDRKVVARKDLGLQRTGVRNTYRLRGSEFAPGQYRIVLSARDKAGHRLSTAKVGRATTMRVQSHRFPVAGSWNWGGAGSGFGAPRKGHKHMGYDITSPEGTAVVAPIAGTIKFRQFQRSGAGYYLILDGTDGFDYAFMHLQEGSLLVNEGDSVRTGQRIASVGTTGGSTGPHLHFEMWQGEWWFGGKPIDPEPYLRGWASS